VHPFNDHRQVALYGGYDLDQVRLYQRWTVKNELKLLRAKARTATVATPVGYTADLEAISVGR
jgi:hypothetical protein